MLIDLQGQGGNNLGGHGQPPMGFIDFPQPPALPVMPQQPQPFSYPAPGASSTHTASAPFNYNIPPYPTLDQEKKDLNTQFLQVNFIRYSIRCATCVFSSIYISSFSFYSFACVILFSN